MLYRNETHQRTTAVVVTHSLAVETRWISRDTAIAMNFDSLPINT